MTKNIKKSRKTNPTDNILRQLANDDQCVSYASPGFSRKPVIIASKFENRNVAISKKFVNRSKIALRNYRQKINHIKIESQKRQKQLKVLYYAGCFGIVIGYICQFFLFLAIYLEYPTIVELNVTNDPGMPFPAVTVCNSNPVKYKTWCEEDRTMCVRNINETIEHVRDRQGLAYDRLGKDKRIDLGYSLNEFVIYAEYEDESVIDRFQQYYDYEFTNCFTFNGAWGANRTVDSAFVFNPVTGKYSELLLCVNMDTENYSNLTGKAVDARVRMIIHANDIIPNPTYDAASLEAGKIYTYGVGKVITRLLKYPYPTNCRNYQEEEEYRTKARMNQMNCLLECFKSVTEDLCQCTYRRLALMYNAKPCEDPNNTCLNDVEDRVFDLCDGKCPMACQKTEFEYVTTFTEPLTQESKIFGKMNVTELFNSFQEIKENVVCMSIHYGSTETRIISHSPEIPVLELCSLLGGFSGLWIGFSLLKSTDVVLTKLIDYFSRRKTERKKKCKTLLRKRECY